MNSSEFKYFIGIGVLYQQMAIKLTVGRNVQSLECVLTIAVITSPDSIIMTDTGYS